MALYMERSRSHIEVRDNVVGDSVVVFVDAFLGLYFKHKTVRFYVN